jgi:hypothetical protein
LGRLRAVQAEGAMSDHLSFRDKVALLFRAQPNQWVNARLLMQVGGAMAWRTRISDCHLELGMDIKNRQRRLGSVTVSEYRYTPKAEPVTPADAADLNQPWILR